MDIEKILPRNEIDNKYKWATEDIYPTDEAFLADLKNFKATIETAEKYNNVATSSAHKLLEYYNFHSDNLVVLDRLCHYAMFKSDEDTSVSKYQDFHNQTNSAFNEYMGAISFFLPQLLRLSDDILDEYYKEEPELLFYKKAIDESRRFSKHILDEQGEHLIELASELTSSPQYTFSLLSNADMKFEPVVFDGKEYPVTLGSFVPLLENPNEEIRKQAFKSLYEKYDQFANTYASLLYSQMKGLLYNAKARHYDSTLELALDETNVDTKVYHNLIETIHNNMDYMYRYVKLRKKVMNKGDLHIYDIYTPLVPESNKKVPFDTAKENVLNALKVFGPKYNEVLEAAFDNRWIDIYENVGKRSGAYSAGCLIHPYVLLNQKDTLDSEFTLAHEMGHAMHSYLSNTTQKPIYADYVIFVAEVASTCNESLLMQYLLKNTTDKTERIALINHFLEQFRGTVYRQTMFAEFELKMNEMVAAGESLTADRLKEEYMNLVHLYFGDDIILDEEISLEWARIPHFYYNYYVYQYATGFSAAIALSNQILNEGQPAVDRYLNFLKSGCTKDPVSLLRDAGVDMANPKPIEDALKLFGELIDELEELLEN